MLIEKVKKKRNKLWGKKLHAAIIEKKTRSTPIGAWKCNFPPFQENMTDRPTNRPADVHEDST